MARQVFLAAPLAVLVLVTATVPVAFGAPKALQSSVEIALFAGGCFWSLESSFEKAYGVISATSGYTGGKNAKPSYENYEENGHVEAVQVMFDPSRISYAELLDVYWHHTDPTDANGAFVDRGQQYRPLVFFANEAQRVAAVASKAALEKSRGFGEPRPLSTQAHQSPRSRASIQSQQSPN